MVRDRTKLFIFATLVLMPILLGLTPLNFVQKIGGGCPLTQGKQVFKCNPCPFDSVSSHPDQGVVGLHGLLWDFPSNPKLGFHSLIPELPSPNPLKALTFLRC